MRCDPTRILTLWKKPYAKFLPFYFPPIISTYTNLFRTLFFTI